MLHSFSFGELALIFGIIIVLFGGSRLASIGKSLGEGISNFKKGLNSGSVDEAPKPLSQVQVAPIDEKMNLQNKVPPQVPSSLPFQGIPRHVVDVESSSHEHSHHV